MIDADRVRRRTQKNVQVNNLQFGKIRKAILSSADRGIFYALYKCDEYDLSVLDEITSYLNSKGYKTEVIGPNERSFSTIIKIGWPD